MGKIASAEAARLDAKSKDSAFLSVCSTKSAASHETDGFSRMIRALLLSP
jgi:hypothetical protein